MSLRDSRVLPDLQVLPLDKLVLHEEADPRRVERLAQRLVEDNRLKNPPVVAPIPGTDRYVVLDGANRVAALVQLGSPHVVAQVVRYEDPGVELDTWYHVVAGISREEFSLALEQIAGMRLVPSTLNEAREALAIGDAAAYIVFSDAVYQVRNGGGPGRLSDIHLLNRLVAAYKGRANIYRASNDVFEKQAPIHPDITALVVFPKYRPADIMMLARNGDKVPSGITRHIIPGRALRINLPLSFIMEDKPIVEKQAWLQQWVRDRANENRIRFYSESTFLFDE
jgi:ParB-like chromosome segregation protein Spo0J